MAYTTPVSNPYYPNADPRDPLDQLALCCGLGRFRRLRNEQQLQQHHLNYGQAPPHAGALANVPLSFYGGGYPLTDAKSSWALANHQHLSPTHLLGTNHQLEQAQNQAYILLHQPVIIATNSNPMSASHQTNTMTLVQHARASGIHHDGQASFGANPFASLPWNPISMQQTPGLISSQYAIYQSSAAAAGAPANARPPPPPSNQANSYFTAHGPIDQSTQVSMLDTNQGQGQINGARSNFETSEQLAKARSLTAETFRQLECIEKQVDLSQDMAHIERFGIVITRPIEANSLRPFLTDAMMAKYKSLLNYNDGYLIRFIEVIKRPGQTLGLYIRSVQVDRGRIGLVITKIESDSPVYNSQVLHIGDEILSINLIDIQGMSIDDVVIIMSLPKRLVLAMRVPVIV